MTWIFSEALIKDCENSRCLPELEEESSAEPFLDGEQCAPLSRTHTQRLFWSHGKTMESFRLSRFGMTCEPLTDDLGAELLTWYLEASRVRTSAPQEREQASTEREADYGRTWRESFAKFDLDTSSWRTAQCSLVEGLDVFSETWPRWGWMRDGECCRQPKQERLTGENACGSSHMWPTPTVCGNHNRKGASKTSGDGLATAVARTTWPTPVTNGVCGGSHHLKMLREKTTSKEARQMSARNGGALNPTWVEWLMGWPLGWTSLEPLGMDKFRQWLGMHGAA